MGIRIRVHLRGTSELIVDTKQERRAFGPLVDECRARGIGRTVAFDLARQGKLETFHIGRRVFVVLDSLDSLPQRLTETEPGVA